MLLEVSKAQSSGETQLTGCARVSVVDKVAGVKDQIPRSNIVSQVHLRSSDAAGGVEWLMHANNRDREL